MNWSNLFVMLITFVFINNVVLNQFLGMCPFMGVSKKSSSAIGMGAAVTFVIVAASLVTYGLYYMVLDPLNLQYMDLITFILVIAALVQLVEMIIKKLSPSLYNELCRIECYTEQHHQRLQFCGDADIFHRNSCWIHDGTVHLLNDS